MCRLTVEGAGMGIVIRVAKAITWALVAAVAADYVLSVEGAGYCTGSQDGE